MKSRCTARRYACRRPSARPRAAWCFIVRRRWANSQRVCSLASQIDSLAAAGAILADVWTDVSMPVVDGLGDEFLASVQTGAKVEEQGRRHGACGLIRLS
jgi:hypothetical protein